MGKKKPTLKSNVNRGFATTSIPKKAQPEPANSTPAASCSSASKSTSGKNATAVADYEKANEDSLAGNLAASGAAEASKDAKEYFDPQKEEEQALQNLVERLQERVEKEVLRQHKAIEYDRRFAKTLPNFDMESAVREQILDIAAALQKPTTTPTSTVTADISSFEDADTLASSSQTASVGASPANPVFTPHSTLTPATADSGTVTPLSLAGPAGNSAAMASLSKDLQSLAISNAAAGGLGGSAGAASSSSSSAFADTEEKVMTRAMSTYQLLLKLGFSSAMAEKALASAASPDLEDCLAFLYLHLDEETLEDALRQGEGKAVKNRRGKDTNKDILPEDEANEDYDESRPPVYHGYEFTRSEALGKGDFARSDFPPTKTVPGASKPGQIDAPTPAAAFVSKSKQATAAATAANSAVPKEKVDALRRASEKLAQQLEVELESDQVETLERPTATWSLLRAMQIRIDQERSKWKKELGKDADTLLKNEHGRLERVLGRTKDFMRECERMAHFDQKSATYGFRTVLRQREENEKQLKAAEAEEDKKRQQRRKEIEAAMSLNFTANTEGSTTAEDVCSTPQQASETKNSAATNANSATRPSASSGNSDKPSAAAAAAGHDDDVRSDDGSEGGFFGDLLNEGPIEENDTETGAIVTLRTLPTQAKSGGGGKTPRVLLSDALKRADAYSSYTFTAIPSGGRLYRSKLAVRWNGGKVVPNKHPVNVGTPTYVDEYTLTAVGCASQLQADDLIATVALFCIDKDKPVQRALPPGYREWWEELDELQKNERDKKSRSRFQRVRDVVRIRMDETGSVKKAKGKLATNTLGTNNVAAANGQTGLGELASASVPPPSEAKAKEMIEFFSKRVESDRYQKMLPGRENLPIAKHRQEILKLVENYQIFVLSGETGCGKSTQVPAYILEHCLSKGQACKIYVTEPRRISAISLAERVSEELGEVRKSVGGNDSLVGYAIRLESNVGKNARLVYATTGIVLRMLEGTAFNDITHIIIDEVHERSIESDFLLIILKTLIAHHKDLKVILMSATVDADRISAYCGGCPTISVPGRTFPVSVHYLEDAVEMSNYIIDDDSPYLFKPKRGWNTRKQEASSNRSKLQLNHQSANNDDDDDDLLDDNDEDGQQGPRSGSINGSGKAYRSKTLETLEKMNEYVINHDLIVKILEHICVEKDLLPYSAATLVFMPGLAEIRKLHDLLAEHTLFGGPSFQLYPLHSTISSENQGAVFEVPPRGVRKIVIATNIAETGITIPDITCVIDSGKHREMRYDEKRQISRLVDCFIARSNAKQRRGRAGRVQEGICFHLFTKYRHDFYLDEHPLPEMLRLSLQDLALKLKVMKIRIGTSIEDALTKALDPPSTANIQRAISALVEVKALTTNEDITHLGRHLSKLPLDVHMGKFLLVAALFRCLDPALTIAAALNSKTPFMTPFGKEAEADRAKQSFKLGDSDFLTIANAFNGFRRSAAQNHHRTFCNKSYLSIQNLMQIEELRQQYFAYLVDARFVTVADEIRLELNKLRYRGGGNNYGKPRFFFLPTELDVNSNSLSMIHATLAAGLYPKLLSIDAKTYQLKTIGNNQPTSIHPSSVNFKVKMSELVRNASSSYMIYYTMMQSKKLYAWETGVLDDRSVYLLCGDADFKLSSNSLYIDRQRIRIASTESPKSLLALKHLREQLSKLINASFRNPGKAWSHDQTKLFDLACQVLGVGANERDLALQQ